MNRRHLNDPVGNWWGAFDNGEVWPVRVLSVTPFGTRVQATHDAAPQGPITLPSGRVYDSDFNRPLGTQKCIWAGTWREKNCTAPACPRHGRG